MVHEIFLQAHLVDMRLTQNQETMTLHILIALDSL